MRAAALLHAGDLCDGRRARSLYDKPPFRSGPAPFPCCCLPFTCCGPPVIYSKTPKCLCIDCSPLVRRNSQYRAVQLLPPPRVCLCFGAPCYDLCGVPYFVGLKNAAEFLKGLKAAYDDNFRTVWGLTSTKRSSRPSSTRTTR